MTTRESDESWQKGQGTPPYDATIEATLAADEGHTELLIEVKGMPLEAVAFYGVGWQIHAAYLAGRERGDSEPRWNDLLPAYQALAAAIAKHTAAPVRRGAPMPGTRAHRVDDQNLHPNTIGSASSTAPADLERRRSSCGPFELRGR